MRPKNIAALAGAACLAFAASVLGGKRIRITTPEPQTMHIINVGGRLVRTAQLPAGDTEVNDLPQGFYIIVLSGGTRVKTLIN